jgi:UDP-N-acetylmuramoyl-tripeptide--D-alanyl-D-alanine ligase
MMTLRAAAQVLNGELVGADREFRAVGTDTRKLGRDHLFVALIGPNHDGHDYLHEALAAGAAGAVVSRAADTALPTVRVADTHGALGQLAAHWRGRFAIPLIGVTGSNGKTTVKNMLAAILGEAGRVLATEGNLNNDIGLPLTLLKLRAGDDYAVIEMGMNHAGEIDTLTRIARPTVALITNAGSAHIGNLGSIEAIARAKGEIFAGLAADGVAVINADDDHASLWRALAGDRRRISFGLRAGADVRADYEPAADGSRIAMHTPWGELSLRLPMPGPHNVMNALAAGAAALAAGARLEHVKAGLEAMRAAPGRLEPKPGRGGARVLDDSYNANPSSLAAALEVLRAAAGERVLVLGDMGELGAGAADLHRSAGELARQVGIERLYVVGDLSRHAVEAFGGGGRHFASHRLLAEALGREMHADMTVLVKGSRLMRMEQVVAAITTQPEPENA